MSYATLPAPPLDATVSPTVATTVIVVMAAMAVLALGFSLVHWRTSGRPTVLMLFLAGGALMVLEPFIDVAGGCWHPSGLARAFMLWQRPMPVWLCLTYFFYFGIGGGLSWLILRRTPSRRALWGLFAAGIVADFVLETVLLHWHVYVYYGSQPLVVGHFPLWWAPVNSLINVALAAAVVRYDHALAGRRQLLIIPLALAISMTVNTLAGWPSWNAINSGFGDVARQLSGLATFAVAFVLMRLIIGAMTGPTPDAANNADTGSPLGELSRQS